jgi:hypothetical protein
MFSFIQIIVAEVNKGNVLKRSVALQCKMKLMLNECEERHLSLRILIEIRNFFCDTYYWNIEVVTCGCRQTHAQHYRLIEKLKMSTEEN